MLFMVRWMLDEKCWEQATITALCFFALLRISECLNLKWSDISFPSSREPGVIRLRQTKTGCNQCADLREPMVWKLLSFLHKQRGGNTEWVFQRYRTGNQFLTSLKARVAYLGLSQLSLTTHSLRHGGATHLFREQVTVNDIAVRGRWADTRGALRKYLQAGKALLLTVAIPTEISKQGQDMWDRKEFLLEKLLEQEGG